MSCVCFSRRPEDRVAGGHAEYRTPHIDTLAREAVMLNDYCKVVPLFSVCSVSVSLTSKHHFCA